MAIKSSVMPLKQWGQASGIGNTTIYKLIGEKKLRPVKIGRKNYITSAENERFVASLSNKANAFNDLDALVEFCA